MKLEDCKKGQRVMYVPEHAHSDPEHFDCECGVISSIGSRSVYVKYDKADRIIVTGEEPCTAESTDPDDLVEI